MRAVTINYEFSLPGLIQYTHSHTHIAYACCLSLCSLIFLLTIMTVSIVPTTRRTSNTTLTTTPIATSTEVPAAEVEEIHDSIKLILIIHMYSWPAEFSKMSLFW